MSALEKLADQLRPAADQVSCGLIGVHFGRTRLHLVQLEEPVGGEIRLRANQSVPFVGSRKELLSSHKAVRTLFKRALKHGRFRGRRVISALPIEHVKLMSLSHPAGSPESEPATIANLMADRVDGPLSDYVIDYVPVRTSIRDGERLCIVAIARREHVIAYLDTLSRAGLQVEALEVAPLAIRRLVESIGSPSKIENVLVINTGEELTYLTLISGRRLLANQEFAFGERQLVQKIATTLDISDHVAAELFAQNGLKGGSADDPTQRDESDLGIGNTLLEIVRPEFVRLRKEIERAFLFAASESYGDANKRIYLFGASARWAGADGLLESLTNLSVNRMHPGLLPFHIAHAEQMNDDDAAAITVASGLALWRMKSDD